MARGCCGSCRMGSVRSRDAVAAWGVCKKCEHTSCWHFPLVHLQLKSIAIQPRGPCHTGCPGFYELHPWVAERPAAESGCSGDAFVEALSHFLPQAPQSVHRALRGPCCNSSLKLQGKRKSLCPVFLWWRASQRSSRELSPRKRQRPAPRSTAGGSGSE